MGKPALYNKTPVLFYALFYSNSWSVQVPVYAVRHDHAEVACPGLGWQFPPHSRGRLDVPATQPGQPFTFAAAPVCKRSGRRRFCNRTRAKIPITQQKSVPNGHGLLLLVCGGDEGDRTPYLLNAIVANHSVWNKYTKNMHDTRSKISEGCPNKPNVLHGVWTDS